MADTLTSDAVHAFRSMASTVTFRVLDPVADIDERMARAEGIVSEVARTCTRFDPTSDLMRMNADPRARHALPEPCFRAVREAYDAYVETDGGFDPRVLEALAAIGYDRSFDGGPVDAPAFPDRARVNGRRWKPSFDEASLSVRLGRDPIDLGGIGKGLAVRWALESLRAGTPAGSGILVEAGGDLATYGLGPARPDDDTRQWRAAVENPFGDEGGSAAVLDVTNAAAATSSIRRTRWTAGSRAVHHLIDPRTGLPAESGLLSVTVVGKDPARAEVWSKSLFLAGRDSIRGMAESRGIAALWIEEGGRVNVSRDLLDRVLWKVSRVH